MEITQIKTSQFRVKTKVASVILADMVKIERKNGSSFEIVEPGEYEIEGVSVFGFGGRDQKTIYMIQAEGLRVLYLTRVEKELSEAQIEELGRVDVMLVPSGVEPILPVKGVVKMVEALEPTFVIPYEAGSSVSTFVAAYERGSREASSLPLNLATLPSDLTEVVVLSVK